MWFIYIILCQDNSLYTGITNNLNRRLVAHQAGIASSYTRSHKPVRIIYTEQAKTKSNALKREIEIKSWSRTKKIATLKLVL
jgi:putative endonuclease